MISTTSPLIQNEYTIRGTEIDFNYRLKPYHMASYFQENFARFCADNQLAAYQLENRQITWVLADMQIELIRQIPFWRKQITVTSWHRQAKGLRLTHEYQAFCEGTEIARGTSTWLILHTQTRKPLPLAELDVAFHIHPNPPFGEFPRLHLENYPQQIAQAQQQVKSYDIDFNHHLNSVRYIAGAIETIPFAYREHSRCASIKVRYLQEVHLDEVLHGKTYQAGHCFYHRIEHRGLLVCEINTQWESA